MLLCLESRERVSWMRGAGGALSGMRSSRAEKGNANWACCRAQTRCRLAALRVRTEASGLGSLMSNLAAVGVGVGVGDLGAV